MRQGRCAADGGAADGRRKARSSPFQHTGGGALVLPLPLLPPLLQLLLPAPHKLLIEELSGLKGPCA